ncbi:MAG TPA: hypothetical protein VFZ81_14775, partial [Burkholderiales bacterium]
MSEPARPRIAITVGDPRGIGPEIIGKALADPRVRAAASYVVVGPRGTRVAAQESIGDWRLDGDAALAGELAGLAIERAVALIGQGEAQGLVTGPIDKRALLMGGYDHP